MATSEWIESAARNPKPPGGDGFIDRKAQHILAGASGTARHDQREEAAAARLLAREAPDVADAIGIALPAWTSPADAVVTAAARGGADGVRAWADTATRSRVQAARRGLGERRAQREGR